MTRAERYQQVKSLRSEGLPGTAIAARLGLSAQYVSELLCDPDGAGVRARKDSYRRPCPNCGKPMDGSNGCGRDAPSRCSTCATGDLHPTRYWTRELVIEAIQEFHRVYHEIPAAGEFTLAIYAYRGGHMYDLALARQHRRWPDVAVVRRLFGSWNAGIAAAGFTPNNYSRKATA